MNDTPDILQALDVSDEPENLPAIIDQNNELATTAQEVALSAESEEDYDTARNNIKVVIEQANAALQDLAGLAKQAQHPRMYEVLASMMKTMLDANESLVNLKIKKKKEAGPTAGPSETTPGKGNVTNNLFVGSTAELQKLIEARMIKTE